MEGKKTWWLLNIIMGFVLLFPLSVSARSTGSMAGRTDATYNKSSNYKATLKYEYQRLVKFYLYNDGQIDPEEHSVLEILEKKWRISPKEVEKIHQEAKRSIR